MVKRLLVIESPARDRINWYDIFSSTTVMIDGTEHEIEVDIASWPDIRITSYGYKDVIIELAPSKHPLPNSPQEKRRTFKPDFMLVRSITNGLHGCDSSNNLYTLMHAGIPAVNSLHSIYMCLERPVVFGELLRLQAEMGDKEFPVIPQHCYATGHEMLLNPGYPCVVKVGHVHAGYGKIKVDNSERFMDVRSLVVMHGDYCTAEEFIEREADMRIQKIGNHYRVFKRTSLNWKGNTGNAQIEECEVTERYKRWADACAGLFGGLDILAVDTIIGKDGREFILEVNDTAIGLVHTREAEDNQHIKELVIRRMEEELSSKAVKSSSTSTATNELVSDLQLQVRLRDAKIAKLQSELEAARATSAEAASEESKGKCLVM
jgi:glutathione synthase/RimK-type ligase-like ATP-grasp enzyme